MISGIICPSFISQRHFPLSVLILMLQLLSVSLNTIKV